MKDISIAEEDGGLFVTCDCCGKRVKSVQELMIVFIEYGTPVYFCRKCVNDTKIKLPKDKEKILTNKK